MTKVVIISILVTLAICNYCGLDFKSLGRYVCRCKEKLNQNRNGADRLKSVPALSDLLSTSVTHGTFSRPSTKRGLILIGLELNTNARESFEDC